MVLLPSSALTEKDAKMDSLYLPVMTSVSPAYLSVILV